MPKIKTDTIVSQVRVRADGLVDSASITPAMAEKMISEGAILHAIHLAMIEFSLLANPGQLSYLIKTEKSTAETEYRHGIDVHKFPDDRHADREDAGIVKIILDDIERTPEWERSIESLSSLAYNTYFKSHGHHALDLGEAVVFVLAGSDVKFKYISEPDNPDSLEELPFDFRYIDHIVEIAVGKLLNQFGVPGSAQQQEEAQQ